MLADVPGQNYSLDWASTAESGIAAFEAGNFDVGLVDFYLGALHGDAVIAELRKRKTRSAHLADQPGLDPDRFAVMDAGAENSSSRVTERGHA